MENIHLMHGDCLERMKEIPDGSVDMVLADPPYGATSCKWDTVIDLPLMWEQLKRITKKNGAIVMTASQPFTTTLIASNLKAFKYCWVWDKKLAANFANAKRHPLRVTEDIVVFGGSAYYPQKTHGRIRKKGGGRQFVGMYGERSKISDAKECGEYYPTNIIDIQNTSRRGKLHPTQKPVALMEYLIKTYTNEGETVLDFTMGSGTTGVACVNTGRKFIGIEMDDVYFAVAEKRIEQAYD